MRLQGLVFLVGAFGAGCGDIDHPPPLGDFNATPQSTATESPTMRSDPPNTTTPSPAPPPVPDAPQPGGGVPLGGGLLGVPPVVEGTGGQPGSGGSAGGVATPSGTVSPDEGVFEGPGVAVDVDDGEISERDGGTG